MVKLTERMRVKDLANIARSDNLQDDKIDNMISQVSEEVERLTRRLFEKISRVEYFTSYEQEIIISDPQILLVDAWPIDLNEPFELSYSRSGDHTSSYMLESDSYSVDFEKGFIWVNSLRGDLSTSFMIEGTTYAPRGFKLSYTGGYDVSAPSQGHISDPLDDFGVAQVPIGLQNFVAQKVAEGISKKGFLEPWSKEELNTLKVWAKKDLI